MVVKLEVASFIVCKVLLHNESSIDVLYWLAFKQLGIPERQIESFLKQLIVFVGETIDTIIYVHLLTTVKGERGSRFIMIKYLLVDPLSSYNILIGYFLLNELGAIILTAHLVMKFPSEDEKIITARADQMTTRECYSACLMIAKGKRVVEPKVQLVACTSLKSNLGEAKLNPREA